MNRREEYWVLTEQLRREPPELESAVRRGMDRARRRRRRPAELLAGLAGVCAAFVVMVNASPAFAISCAKVPVLRELAAAVAFSPSLRAAVEQVPPDNERWQEYHDLVDAFRYFEPVDPALVAPDSLLREFIGGGRYHY